jgi:uncharacterized protein (DUF1800 family)
MALSRRSLVTFNQRPASGTGGTPAPATRPQGARRDDGLSDVMTPIKPERFGYEQARHLLWRAGFGGTASQVQTLVTWGPEKSVDYLLNAEAVPFDQPTDDLFNRDIMRPPTAEERQLAAAARRGQDEETLARLRLMRQQAERQDRQQIGDVQRWWLRRMIETPRPLEEKMTLFWHGHFATNYRSIENSYHMFAQNELFRRHALGNFGELLFGIIRDPAMLAYLNNNQSRRGRPNENLAREIMELFALGLGNYTERDIKEGARALTGYTFDDDRFVFLEQNHDDGPKTILGVSGRLDGDGFVKAILAQRGCSTFIARKLYAFFAGDLPPDERWDERAVAPEKLRAVRTLAAALLEARYDLKPALRRLFLSEHFYSPALMNEQIKSPAVLVVGAVRSLNTPVRDLSILNDALDLMGQNLFFPPSVKGWEGGRSWINTSTLFVRQNLLTFLLTGKKPVGYDATADTQKYDPTPLLSELASSGAMGGGDAVNNPAQVVPYLLRLTIGHAPEHAVTTLTDFVRTSGGGITRDTLVGLLLLITAMPEYQLC